MLTVVNSIIHLINMEETTFNDWSKDMILLIQKIRPELTDTQYKILANDAYDTIKKRQFIEKSELDIESDTESDTEKSVFTCHRFTNTRFYAMKNEWPELTDIDIITMVASEFNIFEPVLMINNIDVFLIAYGKFSQEKLPVIQNAHPELSPIDCIKLLATEWSTKV